MTTARAAQAGHRSHGPRTSRRLRCRYPGRRRTSTSRLLFRLYFRTWPLPPQLRQRGSTATTRQCSTCRGTLNHRSLRSSSHTHWRRAGHRARWRMDQPRWDRRVPESFSVDLSESAPLEHPGERRCVTKSFDHFRSRTSTSPRIRSAKLKGAPKTDWAQDLAASRTLRFGVLGARSPHASVARQYEHVAAPGCT